MKGKTNISLGLISLGLFMLYGFYLIYMRDFSSAKDAWIAESFNGKHFESKLAHVHGNLFALLNIMLGYLLLRFGDKLKHANLISYLGLAGMLMPIGIFSEVVFGLPPYLVVIGAISMIASVLISGYSFYNMKTNEN